MSIYKALALVSHALFVLGMCLHASADSESSGCNCSPNPTKTIVVYIQGVQYTGANTTYTDRSVSGIQGTAFGPKQFSTINANDNVTIAASPSSTIIGRYGVIYSVFDEDKGVFHVLASFIFTGGQYANSTLNIQGIVKTFVDAPSQLVIIEGTNTFNGALGNVTLVRISKADQNGIVMATIQYTIPI